MHDTSAPLMTTDTTMNALQPAPPKMPLLGWLLTLVLCAVLSFFAADHIKGDSIKGDATQNLVISYNLYHHGDFSRGGQNTHHVPTSFREPLPPFVTAAYLKLFFHPDQPYDFESWHNGAHTRLIKLGNLYWVFGGLLATALIIFSLTASPVAVLLGLGLNFTWFFGSPFVINSLYTELPAATLMLWASFFLLRSRHSNTRWSLTLAGVFLGLLCLTKAVFIYVAPVAAVLFALMLAREQHPGGWLRAWGRSSAWLMLCAALVVAPWILRNQLRLGTAEVSSGRSGYVSFKRATMNQMSAEELRYAYFNFGPPLYKSLVSETDWGRFRPEDLQRGGALNRLNYFDPAYIREEKTAVALGQPERATTFYYKPAAIYRQLVNMLVAGGHPKPHETADRIMQREALKQFASHPLQHLRMTLLVFWRGFWALMANTPLPFSQDQVIGPLATTLSNLAAGAALFGVFLSALLRRRTASLAISVLPVCMMGLYALLSHNLPRFTEPAVPLMFISVLWVTQHALAGKRRATLPAP